MGIFDAEGATNVTWAWCGTAWGMKTPDSATSTAGSAYQYYPGDDVIDWVCADGFNWARASARRLKRLHLDFQCA